MKRLAELTIILSLCLAVVPGAMALPFPISDVRALGMGGAFVAAGEGISAVQYNPALLGKDSTVGVSLPEVILRIEDHIGLADLIDELNDPATLASPAAAVAILAQLDEGGALDIQAGGAAGAGFDLFGISAGLTYAQTIYGTAYPDNISTDPGNVLDTNYNNLQYRAVESRQIIMTGAKSFGSMILGANVRSIDATVYMDEAWLFDDPGTGVGDIADGIESDESATAIDVGVFMNVLPMLDVGIVGRDINGPEIGDVEFEARYRVGAALNLPMITIAADYDVGENSVDDGTEYQEWAVGAEFDLWAIALRGGLSQNTGQSGATTLLHLGVGLGFIDIGAAYAEEGDYYIAGANLTLGF